jgi:extracellular elastinolytic metalloproteinase
MADMFEQDLTTDVRDTRRDYCFALQRQLRDAVVATADGQTPLSGAAPVSTHALQHMFGSNCATAGAELSAAAPGAFGTPQEALLAFMVDAAPDAALAEDISGNYPAHLERMTGTPVHHLAGDAVPAEMIDNVPGTVNPVKASLAYVQVPTEDGQDTVLSLVYKVRPGEHSLLSKR